MRSHFAPIPGSGLPPRGLFIDRWGTLLQPPQRGVCRRFQQAEFYPEALEALFHAGQSGWNVYLIGNEDAVAFGRLSPDKWTSFENDLLAHLSSHGIPIRRSYACLDNPGAQPPHDKDSVFLLPNTGALYHAAQMDGVALQESWVIGDSTLELVAGWRAGCHLAGVLTGNALNDGHLQVDPDLVADSLAAALREVTAGGRISRP